MQMMKTDGIADGVRQAALYCISAVIEENGMKFVCLTMSLRVGVERCKANKKQ